MGTDREQAVIINETLASELGWEDPVGRLLPGYKEDQIAIIGVVEDYHFQSLRTRIEPALLHMSPSLGSLNFALIRIRTDQIAPTLAGIRDAWQEAASEQPFDYEFLDERLSALYESEMRWGTIVRTASFFALLIASLGLFGLATLSVQRRRKEIGVRRVMGASSTGLVLLLSRDFAWLVTIAFLLASPLAYFAMDYWLDGFAYHTELKATTFLLAGGLALFVALLTVSFQAVKAAFSNPVNSLRYE
jgi:putative ABC transport system permease protein